MSGTASRFQSRFGYAPGLRVGQYPGAQPAAPVVPALGTISPITARPSGVSAQPAMAPAPAVAAPPPVMVGSMDPERLRNMGDGAGASQQGDYGGPGPSGIGSTGNFGQDVAGFANEAGRAAANMASPMGLTGFALGTIASGLADLAGFPGVAGAIARSQGLTGPAAYSSLENPALGLPKGPEESASEMAGISPDITAAHDMGHDNGVGSGAGTGATGADPGGHESGHAGGVDGTWQKGGYTGPGADGVVQPSNPAGTVHEGEVVIPAHQVQRYGLDPLMLLARGQVPVSRLSSLLNR